MQIFWRRFVGWVTELRNDPFQLARLKLTLIYTIVITGALLFYLGLQYVEFTREVLTFARQNVPVERRQRFIKRSTAVIKTTLFTIQPGDVGMFFLTFIISYVLAGFALKPIKKTVQAQKKFLADASHELRTPLTIIRAEMEVFLRDKSNLGKSNAFMLRKRQSMLSNLEEIDRMQQIIDNLLFFSRVDINQESFRFINLNLFNLVDQVTQRLGETAKRKHMYVSVKGDRKAVVLGDPIRLEQAFLNIIKNAIKYTPQGGNIGVTVNKLSSGGEILVTDNGIGIPAKDLPHIFERFFRANNRLTKQAEGVGLGLTIAKLIVNKHKGTILVKSALGKGTTVKVFLPHSLTS